MSYLDLTHETWLDLTVNVVPLGILLFMDILFWVVNPWGWDPVLVFISHFLTLFPFALLALLTYVSGRVVQRDEGKVAGAEEAAGPEEAAGAE